MEGLMQDRPLLIWQLLEHGARHHGHVEIVSRRVEGDIHRYTYRDALQRAYRVANAIDALGIAAGEIVVDGDDMHLAGDCVQECGQGCHEGFPFPGFHLRNLSIVEHHPPNQLHIKMAQYQQGEAFIDALVAHGGDALVRQLWQSPTNIPTRHELVHPQVWIDRIMGPVDHS